MSPSMRTEIKTTLSDFNICHEDKLVTIGSCFSQHIGDLMTQYKFDVLSNPFGTVYNPLSIFYLLRPEPLLDEHFVTDNELFFHLDFHSEFRARDQKTLATIIQSRKNELETYLRQASVLIITFGTTYVYEYKRTGHVISNCHKIPQQEFKKRKLSLEEMHVGFETFKKTVKDTNPNLRIITTVSPVRHLKDGLEENQLSKSLLRVFCHELRQQDQVSYFPAYEIMMDDLRDYRFYNSDLIHPTDLAIDYIWDKFQHTYFSSDTRRVMAEWKNMLAALAHRPFNPASEMHQKFLKMQLEKLDLFSTYFDVAQEMRWFEKQMHTLP